MKDFKDYDDGYDWFSRHLAWETFIEDGVVLLDDDDDSLMAVIEYRGHDQRGMLREEVLAAAHAAAAVYQNFTSGWVLHIELRRYEGNGYPASQGRHPVPELIDRRRRKRLAKEGRQWQSRYYVTVSHYPKLALARTIEQTFTTEEGGRRKYHAYRDHIVPFKQAMELFAANLGRAVGWARMLDRHEVTTYLSNCVCPDWRERVEYPDVIGFPLRQMVADHGLIPNSLIWTNGVDEDGAGDDQRYIGVIGILGYPSASKPHFFNEFDELPFELRYVMRYEGMSRYESRVTHRKKWSDLEGLAMDVRGVLAEWLGFDAPTKDAVGMKEAQEALEARLDAEEPGVMSGRMTPSFVVWGWSREEVEHKQREIAKILEAHHFRYIVEGRFGRTHAFQATLPGHARPNPRKAVLNNIVLSDLTILTSQWRGPDWNRHLNCPPLMYLETEGGGHLNFDFYSGQFGALLLLAPQGEGKSTVEAALGHQWLARVPNGRVVWIDVDSALSTSMVATWMAGGEYLSFGDGDLALKPLADIDTDDGMAWNHAFFMEWFAFQKVLGENGVSRTEAEEKLTTALELLAAGPEEEWRITHLWGLIQKEELSGALLPLCEGQPLGDLMDSPDDRIADSPWITVDIGALLSRGAEGVSDFVVRALFRRFYRLFQDGRPTLFLIGEGHKVLTERPVEIAEMMRRGRKHNVAVVIETHTPEDVLASRASAILKKIQNVAVLRDVGAVSNPTYGTLGINERQRRNIADLERHNGIFFRTPEGNATAKLELDEVDIAICGCGMAEQRDAAQGIMDAVGPKDFPVAWLDYRQQSEAARELEDIQDENSDRDVHRAAAYDDADLCAADD